MRQTPIHQNAEIPPHSNLSVKHVRLDLVFYLMSLKSYLIQLITGIALLPDCEHKEDLEVIFAYTCTLCSETFAMESSMRQHYDKEHAVIPFKCSLCSKQYVMLNQLTTHLLKIHQCQMQKCNNCNVFHAKMPNCDTSS